MRIILIIMLFAATLQAARSDEAISFQTLQQNCEQKLPQAIDRLICTLRLTQIQMNAYAGKQDDALEVLRKLHKEYPQVY